MPSPTLAYRAHSKLVARPAWLPLLWGEGWVRGNRAAGLTLPPKTSLARVKPSLNSWWHWRPGATLSRVRDAPRTGVPGRNSPAEPTNLNPAVQKPRMTRMTRMTRMGKGFVMVENLFRGHPPGKHPLAAIPSLSVLSAKSVVSTAVFGTKGSSPTAEARTQPTHKQ